MTGTPDHRKDKLMRMTHLLEIAATVLLASCAPKSALTVPVDRQSCLWSDCLADEIPGAETSVNPEFGPEEFVLTTRKGRVRIEGGSEVALLYGAYEYQRRLACGTLARNAEIHQKPAYGFRILNHWDNMAAGGATRGTGRSLWWPASRPFDRDRVRDYARACASAGINGVVLNNFIADYSCIAPDNLQRASEVADILRPYGVKVYLSIGVDFDPSDPAAVQWWKDNVARVYDRIPDFGGFLIKANSEGKPGPKDYGHTHYEGAKVISDALRPYGGLLIWRAFVYDYLGDRAAEAYDQFQPMDGKFEDNTIVQIKNGPLDFQPREPFSPLFGAMKDTRLGLEVQIMQEYFGYGTYFAYLAPSFEECLDADTYRDGEGSFVSGNIELMSGVSNVGNGRHWTGNPLSQANWYAFGRLAWNPTLSSEDIAREWIDLSFPKPEGVGDREFASRFKKPLLDMMMSSRETAVNFMTPLGLHHQMARDHYQPEPWRDKPMYFNQAAEDGLGFDRTATGSNAVAQYNEPLRSLYADMDTCPENLLLWFHHVPWDFKMKSGRTMWDELCVKYDEGVKTVREYQSTWASLEKYVSPEVFETVTEKLTEQEAMARKWRNCCVQYFQLFSGRPVPECVEPSDQTLEELGFQATPEME